MADAIQPSGLDFIDNMDSTKNLSKGLGSGGFASATNTNQFLKHKKSTQGDFGSST